jgi:hypothetical protein
MKLVANAGETAKAHTLKAMLNLQVCKTHLYFLGALTMKSVPTSFQWRSSNMVGQPLRQTWRGLRFIGPIQPFVRARTYADVYCASFPGLGRVLARLHGSG